MAYDFEEAKDEWRKIKSYRAYPYVIAVLRAALIFGLYYISSNIATWCMWFGRAIPALREDISELSHLYSPMIMVISFFLLNSTLINFSNFNRDERLNFTERYCKGFDWEAERNRIRKSPFLWMEIATISVLFFFTLSASFSTGLFKLIE